ncbi:hypothetical protein HKD37_06G014651 [Glycine soja]|nr:hypothetical protein GmHk_06G014857 [Glycine max]
MVNCNTKKSICLPSHSVAVGRDGAKPSTGQGFQPLVSNLTEPMGPILGFYCLEAQARSPILRIRVNFLLPIHNIRRHPPSELTLELIPRLVLVVIHQPFLHTHLLRHEPFPFIHLKMMYHVPQTGVHRLHQHH